MTKTTTTTTTTTTTRPWHKMSIFARTTCLSGFSGKYSDYPGRHLGRLWEIREWPSPGLLVRLVGEIWWCSGPSTHQEAVLGPRWCAGRQSLGGSQPHFCTSPGIVACSFFTAQWRLALCTANCLMWAQIRWRSSETRSWFAVRVRFLHSTPLPLWLRSWRSWAS